MHELSIAHAVVATVEDAVPDPATRVLEVHLRVGALSGVVPEALEFAYDVAVTGTRLADAVLVVERVPLTLHCARCAADVRIDGPLVFTCPRCGEPSGDVRAGSELELTRLVLADDDGPGVDPVAPGPDPARTPAPTLAPVGGGVR